MQAVVRIPDPVAVGSQRQAVGNQRQAVGNQWQAVGNQWQAVGNQWQAVCSQWQVVHILWKALEGTHLLPAEESRWCIAGDIQMLVVRLTSVIGQDPEGEEGIRG